jgi:hypothetical protein
LAPGICRRPLPVSGLVGDISFSGRVSPQAGHSGGAAGDKTRVSPR